MGQVATAILEDVGTFQAFAIAEGFANAFTYNTSFGFPSLFSTSVSFNPGALVIGAINSERIYLQAMQEIQIQEISSAATIKNLLLEQAEKALALREHELRIRQAGLRAEQVVNRIRRDLTEWQLALQENADAYWTDPGYRLEMEHAVARAHISLRNAQEAAFLAAKALGYDWADEFPGDALLPPPYNNFLGPEDIFGVPNAQGVLDFLAALEAYNTDYIARHGPRDDINDAFIKLREDILGYSDFDPGCQCSPPGLRAENIQLFKQFIRDHWVNDIIQFEFSISVADNKLFPIQAGPSANIWNVKINQIAADMSGEGLVAGPADFPEFSIILGGMSTVRHWNAKWEQGNPSNDILVQYDLESLNEDGSLRTANIQPSLDGFPSEPEVDFNTQLERLSVAATRWTVFINTKQGDNVWMDFNNLEEIVFWIKYDWGQPDPYTP